jgi:hypothetical protein
VSVIFAGCGPETKPAKKGLAQKADLAMKFSVGDTTMYKVKVKAIKDFRFEQPSLGKLKEEQTGSEVELEFLQEIVSVDNKGSAVANITVKGLKYLVKNKAGVKLDYDSEKDTEKKHYLSRLLGKSYKIKLTSNGKVKVVDIKEINRVSAEKIVKNFLSKPRIKRRHEILAFPNADKSVLAEGENWSRVKSSPPGLLAPKNFEKIYTLKNVSKDNIASVEMNAIPTSKIPKEAPSGDQGMGVFAKMFDSEETFKGQLVIDLNTGKVQKYDEELIALYVAAESPREQKEGKGPDTLTMGFTHSVNLEVIE